MKRLCSLLLVALAMLFLFCACKSDDQVENTDPDTSVSDQQTPDSDTDQTSSEDSDADETDSEDSDTDETTSQKPDTNTTTPQKPNTDQTPSQKPDTTPTTPQDPTPSKPANAYEPVLAQYRAAIANNFYRDVLAGNGDFSVIGEQINTELLYASTNFDTFYVFYALQDIDNNGVQELVIGGSDSINTVTNYDVFTLNGTQIVPLFPNMQFGYRTTLRILSGGIFAVNWSNSAAHYGNTFYRITGNGTSVEEVESVCCKADPDAPDTLLFYHDAEGTNAITEDAYNSILDGYAQTPAMQLSWNTLSAS